MLKKLNYATLFVRDQDKALDFYVNTLGFEKRGDNTLPGGPRFLTVGLPGQNVEIVLWKGTPVTPKDAAPGGSGGAWALETDDCQKEFEQLASRGVKFEQAKPVEAYGAVYATFADPDGNRFMIQSRNLTPAAALPA
jgi:catechol 2,3-dioxygenase-like lactoylglutathione lyase family enzyme